jgi:hypothetical protein
VTKEGYIILDEENLTPNDRINKQCNTAALNKFVSRFSGELYN